LRSRRSLRRKVYFTLPKWAEEIIIHQFYCLQDLLVDIILKVGQTADNKARRHQSLRTGCFTPASHRGDSADLGMVFLYFFLGGRLLARSPASRCESFGSNGPRRLSTCPPAGRRHSLSHAGVYEWREVGQRPLTFLNCRRLQLFLFAPTFLATDALAFNAPHM